MAKGGQATEKLDLHNSQADIQYYIHNDVENWIKQTLDDVYGEGSLTYHEQYHFDLDHVRFIKIRGDQLTIKGAVERIELMHLQTQYHIPWMDKNVYYVRNKEQRNSVELKLISKHVKYFKMCNSSDFTEKWFHLKDLEVFMFGELTKTKRRLVERVFKQMAESYDEPILSIFNPLPFHEASGPATKMATNVLVALNGTFMKYLHVEDILSLEVANKDHRVPWVEQGFETILDRDIQTHLKRRMPLDNMNSILSEFKLSSVLSYFIYKYRMHIKSSIRIPPILSRNDIRTLSQLFGIEIWFDKDLLTKKSLPNNQNTIAPDILKKYLSPIRGYHIYHNFNVGKLQAKKVRNTILVRAQDGSSSVILHQIFTNLREFLNTQIHVEVDLHLIEIDCLDQVPLSHLSSFSRIVLEEISLDIGMLSKLFRCIRGKINYYNCTINNDSSSFDILDIPIRVSEIVFKHMSFEVDQLIAILSNSNTGVILFNDCSIIPAAMDEIGIRSNSINLNVEFKNMKYSRDLLKILKLLGEDSKICFNGCGITNIDIRGIYSSTTIRMSQIKIMADHQVDENIVLELFIEHHRRTGLFEVGDGDFDVPAEIIPEIVLFTPKFNWAKLKLRPVRVHDHVIKVDIVKNGKVVDLFDVQNGLET